LKPVEIFHDGQMVRQILAGEIGMHQGREYKKAAHENKSGDEVPIGHRSDTDLNV
jgi:hypothetical protein